jgi:hypothetical protein
MLTVSKYYETTKHAVPAQETCPIQCSEIYISAMFVKLSQNTSRMIYMDGVQQIPVLVSIADSCWNVTRSIKSSVQCVNLHFNIQLLLLFVICRNNGAGRHATGHHFQFIIGKRVSKPESQWQKSAVSKEKASCISNMLIHFSYFWWAKHWLVESCNLQ